MNIYIYIINTLHILLYISLLSSVFIPVRKIKELSLIFLVFLMAQFIINQGKCFLTEVEYFFKKEKKSEGLLYRLIYPVIKRDEKYFNNYYYIIHILWIIILFYQIFF